MPDINLTPSFPPVGSGTPSSFCHTCVSVAGIHPVVLSRGRHPSPFCHTCVFVAGIHPKGNQDGFPIKNVGNDNLVFRHPRKSSAGGVCPIAHLRMHILDGDSGRPFTWSSRINILLIKFEFLVRVLPSYFGNPQSEVRHKNTYKNNSFSFSRGGTMNPIRKCLWANVLLRLSMMAACILLTGSAAFVLQLEEANAVMPSGEYGKDWGDPKGEECVMCHRKHSPGLYAEWNKSKHGQRGRELPGLPQSRRKG